MGSPFETESWGGRPRWIGPALAGFALIVVAAMIAIGGGRLTGALDDAGPSMGASVYPSSTVSTFPPDEQQLLRRRAVSFVDIRNGRAAPLPRTVRALGRAEQFAVSPDGGRMAFVSTDGIYVARIDGSKLRRVVSARGLVSPAWSPDGDRLVYSNGNEGFLVDLATGSARLVINADGPLWRPTFSPDGRRILFTRLGGRNLALFTVSASGGASTLLMRNAAFGSFSPDGTIVFRVTDFSGTDVTEMTNSHVWLAASDGSNRRPVNGKGGGSSQVRGDALWPNWSTDGRWIVAEMMFGRGITVIDRRTGDHRRIGLGFNPAWVDANTLIIEGYLTHGPSSFR